MHFDLDIKTIKNFVVIAEMNHISNAAERLHITQPTLSRQVAGLEARLHTKLLDRTKSGVVLTESGEAFYQRCKRLVKEYDDFLGWTQNFKGVISGTLNVAYQKVCENMFIQLQSGFLKQQPNVTIINHRQDKTPLIVGLCSGELDAAYIYSHELRNSYKHIQSLQVGALQEMLLVSRDNPLSQKSSVHISELQGEPFILASKGNSPCRAMDIMDWCGTYGFSPKVVATADTFAEYLLEVVRHNGVTIFPYVQSMEVSGQVKFVKLEGLTDPYPISIAWSENNTNLALSSYLKFIERQMFLSA